jgi:hypothetical protein
VRRPSVQRSLPGRPHSSLGYLTPAAFAAKLDEQDDNHQRLTHLLHTPTISRLASNAFRAYIIALQVVEEQMGELDTNKKGQNIRSAKMGGFEKGHNKRGRPPGTPNKLTRILKEAILLAACAEGDKEGLIGYLRKIARNDYTNYVKLLLPILQSQTHVKIAGVDFMPAEDVEDGAGEDKGRPITDQDVRDALERKGIDIRKLLNLGPEDYKKHSPTPLITKAEEEA